MKAAVFTFVQDDDPLLPVWERYYPQYFDTVDRVHYVGEFDPEQAIKQVKNKFAELLVKHDVVMFADIDELVIPSPAKYNDLRDYIEKQFCNGRKFAQTFGFDVLHREEAPIDLSMPILPQRTYMSKNSMYSKPLIATEVLQWSLGLHYILPNPVEQLTDRDLVLFHLLLVDRDMALRRISKRRQISEEEIQLRMEAYAEPIPEIYKIA